MLEGGRYCEPEGPSEPGGGADASSAGRVAQHEPQAHAVNWASLYATKPARHVGQKRKTASTDELTIAVTNWPRWASGGHSDATSAHGSERSR